MAQIDPGDVITIEGVYHDHPQKWRVELLDENGRIRLIPLRDDESVDESTDAAGEYWIEARS